MITKTLKGWRVDIQPGGRDGRRFRPTFKLKEHAEAFIRKNLYEVDRLVAGVGADMSVADLIERFTNDYAAIHFRGFKFEKYRLYKMKQYFESSKRRLPQFSLADASAFITTRKRQGMSDGTLGREINTLKRIASWAFENDYLPNNPLAKLKRIKSGKRTRWLTESECEIVLSACKELMPEIYEAVFVALMTGFRLSNILELKAEDFEDEIVWARKTKSGSPYAVPIDPRLKPLVGAFKTCFTGPLFQIANLDKKFKFVMTKIGFYKGKTHPNSVVFHTLRHTFGAYHLNRKVPIYTVSKWLGHSSVDMTESVYAHLSLQHHVELMQQNSDLGRQSVDTQIIPFPEKPSESVGPRENRTPNLVLKRDD